MTLALFNPAPLPVLSSLWNVTQGALVRMEDLTPTVSALRQQLELPGAMGMNNAERTRVQEALSGFVQHAAQHSDSSGLVSGILIRPKLESVVRSFPARWNYRQAGEEEITDEYCIGAEVGSGGCGRIYHGYSLETGMTVAIKVADADEQSGMNQETVVRLLRREYENMRSLPDGVGLRALRFGTLQGKPCMVVEFLLGQDLFEAHDSLHHKLNTFDDLKKLLGVGMLAVRSVAGVHQSGLVHRDIKGENFRIRPYKTSLYEVRTFDFGIARRTGELDGEIAGTPGFMPPESFNPAVPASPQRDVFALGATLYWLLTGRMPFPGDDYREIYAKMTDPKFRPEPPSQILLSLHPELSGQVPPAWLNLLDMVIQRALSRNLSLRYADAGVMLQALRGLQTMPYEPAVPVTSDPLEDFDVTAIAPPAPAERTVTRNDRPPAAARVARRRSVG